MKKSTPAQWATRVILYIVGLFFMALGVAFAVNSDLGVSPVTSLPYVISLITNTALGTCVIVVYGIYIVLQILILRREFRLINLTQIIFSTIFGYFTDFTKWLLADFTLPTYAGQLVMLVISIITVAFGVFLYMEVDLVAMPMEGLTMAIAKKVGRPFHNVKIVVDCSTVVLGILLSVVLLHGLFGIREGTVITAIVVGKVMGLFKKPLQPVVQRLCFGAVGPEPEEVRELEELEGMNVDS
ncbi:YczE/YyaS/YitT family protein [Intestinimonas sp. HCP28S3_D6]|uniref:YczE/YyaS/YitT family protein n=1 Tax=Intestinimonas sp. HCP28S3_D6 TaxID=3438942 RepID=UPI003F888B3C